MSRRIRLIIILIFISLALLAGGAVYAYQVYVIQPFIPQSTQTIEFTLPPGWSGQEVARELEKKGLIRSRIVARWYFRWQQLRGRSIQAGDYGLSPAYSLIQIFELFQHGTFDVQLTIPEGKRLEEIAWLVEQKLGLPAEDFFAAAKSRRGYLFPDTYLVPRDISIDQLVVLMLNTFDQKIDQALTEQLQKQDLSLNQAVTLASVVEREARLESDRPLIAGVLLKRLKNDWRLEADATVQFVKGGLNCQPGQDCQWWPNQLTDEDLELDSSYNTRKYAGLPPAPICSPGLSSLQAVAGPAESVYWYYLSDNEGNTYYSTSYEEHLMKKARYLQ